jgi:hypothetical protein
MDVMLAKIVNRIGNGIKNLFSGKEDSDRFGVERRLSALFPVDSKAGFSSVFCKDLHHRLFFLSLCSNACSCIIEFQSDRRTMRASILMLDGKILGAVYARRSLPNKIFGRNAYLEILIEMANPGMSMKIRGISPQMAISLAPLFGAKHSKQKAELGNGQTLAHVMNRLSTQKLSGMAFVDDKDGATRSAIYFAEGQALCSYSFKSHEHHFGDWGSIKDNEAASLRIMLTSTLAYFQDGSRQLRIVDIEAAEFVTTLENKDLELPAKLMKKCAS